MPLVCVVGAGAWGTALACAAAGREREVALWCHEPQVAEELNRSRSNSKFLPGVRVPASVRASSELTSSVEGAQTVLFACPAQYFRELSSRTRDAMGEDVDVVIACSGIENGTLLLLTQVLTQTLPDLPQARVAVLEGPLVAEQLSQARMGEAVVGSSSAACAERVQALLESKTFRLHGSADPIGVQVAGAVANVIAVAMGICEGLGLGHAATAALGSRGLDEMIRLGVELGADPLTFVGLAGAGKVIIAGASKASRNFELGWALAQGAGSEGALALYEPLADGYYTAAALKALAARLGVSMPVCEAVHRVLFDGADAQGQLEEVFARP